MTVYQLWFRYGAPNKMSPPLLIALLQDANLLNLVNLKGELSCELQTKTPNESIRQVVKEYQGRWLPYQLWYYFKAVKRWKSVKPTPRRSEMA